MPRLHPILLFNERDKIAPRGTPVMQGGEVRSTRLAQPSYLFSWASFSSVELVFHLEKANGDPSAWSLKPRLQIGIAHTSGYQFTNPAWVTLTREQAEARCPSTGWFPDLDQTTATGTWSVIIERPSARMRLTFGESGPDAFTMTGGTNPNLQIALVAHGKA